MFSKLQQDLVNGSIQSMTAPPQPVLFNRPPSLSLRDIYGHVGQLICHRELLLILSVYRVKVRYKQSMLGAFWAILQPISQMLIYTLIFPLVMKVPSHNLPYAVFSYAALSLWNLFSTGVTGAASCLVWNSGLVTKVYFPRELLPFSYIAAACFDFLIALAALSGLMLYFNIHPTWNLLFAIPVTGVLIIFAAAIGLLLSVVYAHVRDIGVILPLLLQLWMFITPVVYPLSAVPSSWRFIYTLNPMVGIVDSFRRTVLLGVPPEPGLFAYSFISSIILLLLSYVLFKRLEQTLVDYI